MPRKDGAMDGGGSNAGSEGVIGAKSHMAEGERGMGMGEVLCSGKMVRRCGDGEVFAVGWGGR